ARVEYVDPQNPLTGGFRGGVTDAQTGYLREAPGAGTGVNLGYAVFQRPDEIRTLEFHRRPRIAERQYSDHLAHRHRTFLDAGADAARIHHRDLYFRGGAHGIRDHVTQQTFAIETFALVECHRELRNFACWRFDDSLRQTVDWRGKISQQGF